MTTPNAASVRPKQSIGPYTRAALAFAQGLITEDEWRDLVREIAQNDHSDCVLTYSEAKARLEAVWPGGMLARYSDDPAERVSLLTVESALAVLFPAAQKDSSGTS